MGVDDRSIPNMRNTREDDSFWSNSLIPPSTATHLCLPGPFGLRCARHHPDSSWPIGRFQPTPSCASRKHSPRAMSGTVTISCRLMSAASERLLGTPHTIAEELGRNVRGHDMPVHVAVARTCMAALVLAQVRPGLTIVDPGQEAAALASIRNRQTRCRHPNAQRAGVGHREKCR